MRKAAFFCVLMFAVVAPRAFGAVGISQHDDISIGGSLSGSSGGPFTANIYLDNTRIQGPGSWTDGQTSADTFTTFCLEYNEHFSPGSTRYDVALINTKTVNTGYYLTGYAAWVYKTYLDEITNPTLNANSERYTFQKAIWGGVVASLTGISAELGTLANSEWGNTGAGASLSLNPAFVASSASFSNVTGVALAADPDRIDISTGAFLAQMSTWSGGVYANGDSSDAALSFLNGYRVLNLQTNAGYAVGPPASGYAQDMIVGPANVLSVPEPASIVVWSLLAGGAAGVGVARKRRQKAPKGRWSAESRQAIFSVIDRN